MIKVKAKEGLKVPMESKPRSYITEDKAVEVEKSAYYARRINEGDLIEVVKKTNPKD